LRARARIARRRGATFDKFMCYCETAASICGEAAENKIPHFQFTINEDVALQHEYPLI